MVLIILGVGTDLQIGLSQSTAVSPIPKGVSIIIFWVENSDQTTNPHLPSNRMNSLSILDGLLVRAITITRYSGYTNNISYSCRIGRMDCLSFVCRSLQPSGGSNYCSQKYGSLNFHNSSQLGWLSVISSPSHKG
jgi:hypothetical protein